MRGLDPIGANLRSSLPGLTRQSIDLRKNFLAKKMDARVKPAHDELAKQLKLPPMGSSPRMTDNLFEPARWPLLQERTQPFLGIVARNHIAEHIHGGGDLASIIVRVHEGRASESHCSKRLRGKVPGECQRLASPLVVRHHPSLPVPGISLPP